jgi:hypothetical protein
VQWIAMDGRKARPGGAGRTKDCRRRWIAAAGRRGSTDRIDSDGQRSEPATRTDLTICYRPLDGGARIAPDERVLVWIRRGDDRGICYVLVKERPKW